MLSPLILSRIYTKDQLLSKLEILKARLEELSRGEFITGIGEPGLNISYGTQATSEELTAEIENIVEALQILDPHTFGNDLIVPRQKFVY